jgi:hypothetical protein
VEDTVNTCPLEPAVNPPQPVEEATISEPVEVVMDAISERSLGKLIVQVGEEEIMEMVLKE